MREGEEMTYNFICTDQKVKFFRDAAYCAELLGIEDFSNPV